MNNALAGMTLLLVDDRPENLLTLEALLETTGAQIKTALSGNEALKLLYRGAKIDCVLMDVQMPDMDGFETAVLFQQMPQAVAIPVVFITADDAQREVDVAYKDQLPEPLFIYKPIDASELLTLLQKIRHKNA